MIIKKMLNKNNPKNTIVRVIFKNKSKAKYECVGVLIKEDKDSIRVAFSAKKDKVVDYIDIKQSNIISIKILNSSDIMNI